MSAGRRRTVAAIGAVLIACVIVYHSWLDAAGTPFRLAYAVEGVLTGVSVLAVAHVTREVRDAVAGGGVLLLAVLIGLIAPLSPFGPLVVAPPLYAVGVVLVTRLATGSRSADPRTSRRPTAGSPSS